MKPNITLTFYILIFLVNTGFGCTTFVLKDSKGKIAFGRNFDFPIADGYIHINYRNMVKSSFIRPPEKPLTWISKFGSVTFNQAGKEFPYGGMNEVGLVIEQMWLQEAQYPPADNRYGMNELQWIQYQLDNAASVKEVIESDSILRISYLATSYLHFLVSDSIGNVATIEYIDGKMLVHQGKDLPYKVLANCEYQHSLNYHSRIYANGATEYNEWTKNSSGRFVKVSELIEAYDQTSNIIDYSFQILDSVHQINNTQWSIVYNIRNLKIYYKSSLHPEIQSVDLNAIDFSCSPNHKYLPIDAEFDEIHPFRELTYQSNLELMERVVNGVEFLKNKVPSEYLEASANYYKTLICNENNFQPGN